MAILLDLVRIKFSYKPILLGSLVNRPRKVEITLFFLHEKVNSALKNYLIIYRK